MLFAQNWRLRPRVLSTPFPPSLSFQPHGLWITTSLYANRSGSRFRGTLLYSLRFAKLRSYGSCDSRSRKTSAISDITGGDVELPGCKRASDNFLMKPFSSKVPDRAVKRAPRSILSCQNVESLCISEADERLEKLLSHLPTRVGDRVAELSLCPE